MTVLVLFGGWRFVHSEKFSREISQKVSKILTEKFGATLSFTGVDFSLFPLSTTFKNVEMKKYDPAILDIEIVVAELEVAFTYSSFISSALEIDEVSIRKGKIQLKTFDGSDDEIILKDLKTKDIFLKYKKIKSLIPVKFNAIALEDIKLNVDNVTASVKKLNISPIDLKIEISANVFDLSVEKKDQPDKAVFYVSEIEISSVLKIDEWRIEKLRIKKGSEELNLRGVAFNEKSHLNFNSSGRISGSIESAIKYKEEISEEFKEMKGKIELGFETSGPIDNPEGKIEIRGENVETPWVKLQKLEATILKKKNILYLQKIEARNNEEFYFLKKANTFYDLNEKKFTNFIFDLHLQNAKTNTFLYSIRESLGNLKGSFSGDILIKLFEDKATFGIKEILNVKKFRLTSKDEKNNILINEGFDLKESTVTVNKDSSVELNLEMLMKNSKIKASGKISSKGIDIKTEESSLDMKTMGPIAGLEINGHGPTDFRVVGPLDDVKMIFDVSWNNFSMLDINLNKVQSHFSLGLKDLDIKIDKMEGSYNKSSFSAEGKVGVGEKEHGLDLKVNFKNTQFADARQMLGLVFRKIKFPLADPDFNFDGSSILSGGFDPQTLKIKGELRGSDFKMGVEDAEKIGMKFNLEKNILNFNQITLSKSRGEVKASASIDFSNKSVGLSGMAQNFRLRDSNFYRNTKLEYDGDLAISFDGSGTTDEFSARLKTKLTHAFIGNTPVASSNAVVYLNPDNVVTNANLLEGKINIDSLINFKTNIAAIKMNIDTDDLREFFGVFSSHNVENKEISGKIKAQMVTQINMGALGVRKFFLKLDDFKIKKGDIDFKINPEYSNVEVDEGVVKKWDLRMNDGNAFFYSKGKNIANGVIGVEQKISLKASLLEMLSGAIEKANGLIKGSAQIILDKKIKIKEFTLFGDDLSLKIKNLTGFITNFDYTIAKNGEIYEVKRMSGEYGEGFFEINGNVLFDDSYPELKLTYKVDRSIVPLFKRSSLLINSTGSLTGSSLPYKLNGKVAIGHGEFLDDPLRFMQDSKISLDEYRQYLPGKNFLNNKNLLDLNISFDTINPVLIKNNMAEVYMRGSGQMTGDIFSPEFSARFETVPSTSKFKFKGHDFALSQGYVEIRDHDKNRFSDLKFTGVSRIGEFDMKLDLSGSISKVNIDLSSEPALSKEDLLSLLTLGVTSDMSKNLEASERRFVTTVGIGTLLVDQLKINEDLNSSFGVKLSVQPEFREDETTLIQGKAAVSDSNVSRLKSATRIKINKQINNRVDVSLSSTVGGSLEQKQEMNINYNINKAFSLEGIYEVKPTEEEDLNTPNSLGVDLKWRKSFSL